VVLEYRFY